MRSDATVLEESQEVAKIYVVKLVKNLSRNGSMTSTCSQKSPRSGDSPGKDGIVAKTVATFKSVAGGENRTKCGQSSPSLLIRAESASEKACITRQLVQERMKVLLIDYVFCYINKAYILCLIICDDLKTFDNLMIL